MDLPVLSWLIGQFSAEISLPFIWWHEVFWLIQSAWLLFPTSKKRSPGTKHSLAVLPVILQFCLKL